MIQDRQRLFAVVNNYGRVVEAHSTRVAAQTKRDKFDSRFPTYAPFSVVEVYVVDAEGEPVRVEPVMRITKTLERFQNANLASEEARVRIAEALVAPTDGV